MRVLIVDNYDSFIYNLYHLVKQCGDYPIGIMKNDEINWDEATTYDKIILSPGPGLPSTSGQLMEVIGQFFNTKTILGVCLGHQAIAEFFGAKLENLSTPLHGVASRLQILEHPLFNELEQPILVGHYHSWFVSVENFPSELQIIATNEHERCMAIAHKNKPIVGVQFHPESILTPQGLQIMKNWLAM